MSTPLSNIDQAVAACAGAKKAVALTGAGISVESGIPPFRGKGGLWEKIDPMKYAHIDALESNPKEVWEVLFMGITRILETAQPNAGHRGLQRLEEMGILKTVITQNVDGLHQVAGSTDVIEFHGSHTMLRCMGCRERFDWRSVSLVNVPPRCSCGAYLRPDVVMFGELIDMERLQRSQLLAANCDVMLVVGTSATVEPAAHLPVIAKRGGAVIIEINPEPTPLTRSISDIALLGPAGEMMDRIVAGVDARRGK